MTDDLRYIDPERAAAESKQFEESRRKYSNDTHLVRLRTAPMPDPGEWCYKEVCRTFRLVEYKKCWHLRLPYNERPCCGLGLYLPMAGPDREIRRPQECIDSAEEVP
jgi:hypothetical protein